MQPTSSPDLPDGEGGSTGPARKGRLGRRRKLNVRTVYEVPKAEQDSPGVYVWYSGRRWTTRSWLGLFAIVATFATVYRLAIQSEGSDESFRFGFPLLASAIVLVFAWFFGAVTACRVDANLRELSRTTYWSGIRIRTKRWTLVEGDTCGTFIPPTQGNGSQIVHQLFVLRGRRRWLVQNFVEKSDRSNSAWVADFDLFARQFAKLLGLQWRRHDNREFYWA